MSEVQMCDVVKGRQAVFSYRWPWGEGGSCSWEGKALLEQQAKNLKRACEFVALPSAQAEPVLERSERTRLIAEKLAAEGECEEHKRRCSRLAQQNQELSARLQNAELQASTFAQEAADLRRDGSVNESEIARLTRENGELASQLSTANTLMQSQTDATEELASLRQQLEAAKAELSRAVSEKNADAEKYRLKIAELERQLAPGG